MYDHLPSNNSKNENRIMFLTDAIPSESEQSIFGISDSAANEKRIYSTLFGLGVDFGVKVQKRK